MTYVLHLSPAIEGDVMAVAQYYAEIDPDLANRLRTLLNGSVDAPGLKPA